MLPEGWREVTLGEVIPDYAKNKKITSSELSDDTWVLELEDIEKHSSKLLKKIKYSERQSKSTKNIFYKGDVLYGKLRLYLNKVIIADDDGVCTTEIIPIKENEKVISKYIFYVLKSSAFLKYVEFSTHGLNMPRLGTASAKKAPFPLPPLKEQKQIAQKLDQVLARVERIKIALDNAPATIKRFRQSVLALGTFGKDFEITQLKALGSMSGGKTPSKANSAYWTDGTVWWVSAKDMKRFEIDSSLDKITENAVIEAKMKLIPKNSILMVTRSGILSHTFPVAITKDEITINQDLKAFFVNEKIVDSKFLAYTLRGEGQNILTKCSKDGTTVPSVSTEKLMNYELNIPPLQEQKAIVKKIETLFAIADNLEAKVTQAQQRVDRLTQSILAKAFRGEL
jgi:type I restriction enzyme S subunit